MSAPAVNGNLLLFGDDPNRQLAVFMTGAHSRAVVIVGSQVENIFSLNCITQLLPELEANEWSSAQIQLASSMVGPIARTHVGDAEDLQDLIGILTRDYLMTEITLFAWSSGVQVALEFLGFSDRAEVITRVILQGSVADPSDEMHTPAGAARRSEIVEAMVADGRRDQIVPWDVYDIPMTAARLSTGGLPSLMEAVWSPAIRKDAVALKSNLAHIKVPLLLIVAMSAQYRPTQQVKDDVRTLVASCASTPEVDIAYFDAAGDERRRVLRGHESLHVATIITFLKECDRRRSEREEAAKQHAAEEMRRSRSILARSLLKGA